MTPYQKTLQIRYKNLKSKIDSLTEELKEMKETIIEVNNANPDIPFEGLTIYTIPPKKSISWKSVAEELNPDEALIDRYTKMTKETTAIKIKQED